MKLFYAAILIRSKKNVVIPSNWCETLDIAKTMNESLNRNESHVIFVSPDKNKEANFALNIDGQFDLTCDGCFWAKITKVFSKYSIK